LHVGPGKRRIQSQRIEAFATVCEVANHGVAEELVDQVFEENRKFFALPEDAKRSILADKNNRYILQSWTMPKPAIHTLEQIKSEVSTFSVALVNESMGKVDDDMSSQ
jgi:isopenicillin N synthase-like dioxygenase